MTDVTKEINDLHALSRRLLATGDYEGVNVVLAGVASIVNLILDITDMQLQAASHRIENELLRSTR